MSQMYIRFNTRVENIENRRFCDLLRITLDLHDDGRIIIIVVFIIIIVTNTITLL